MELVKMCEWLGGLQKDIRIQRSNANVAQVLNERFRSDPTERIHPFVILRIVERRFDDFLSLLRKPEITELPWLDGTLIAAGSSAVENLRIPLQLEKARDSWSTAASHMTNAVHLTAIRGLSTAMRFLYPQRRLPQSERVKIEDALAKVDQSSIADNDELPPAVRSILSEAVTDLRLVLRFPALFGPIEFDAAIARLASNHTLAAKLSAHYRAGAGKSVAVVVGLAATLFLQLPNIDASAAVAARWYRDLKGAIDEVQRLPAPGDDAAQRALPPPKKARIRGAKKLDKGAEQHDR